MNTHGHPQSYIDLASEAFEATVDAMADANQRYLTYARSLWDTIARPYTYLSVEEIAPETFERADIVVKLSIESLQAGGRGAADYARTIADIAVRAQETQLAVLRGIADTSVSNLSFIRDAAASMQTPQTVVHSNN